MKLLHCNDSAVLTRHNDGVPPWVFSWGSSRTPRAPARPKKIFCPPPHGPKGRGARGERGTGRGSTVRGISVERASHLGGLLLPSRNLRNRAGNSRLHTPQLKRAKQPQGRGYEGLGTTFRTASVALGGAGAWSRFPRGSLVVGGSGLCRGTYRPGNPSGGAAGSKTFPQRTGAASQAMASLGHWHGAHLRVAHMDSGFPHRVEVRGVRSRCVHGRRALQRQPNCR